MLLRRAPSAFLPAWAVAFIALNCLAAPADPREHFETKVRPLLAKNCYACHTQTKLGGLRLDSRDAILKGGNSGPAFDEDEPAQSLLLQAVTHQHVRLKMPPTAKLDAQDIDELKDWVEKGLYWPAETQKQVTAGYVISPEQRAFWSFQPIRKPEPPQVQQATWVKTPIDRFLLAKMEEQKLKPVPEADRRILIRRATLDLLGLPPTPQEVQAFLDDTAPGAFARLVDRLLASPQYGERWGRHWLDVARYADDKLNSTQDEPYANAFRYRNWVIRALNEDMPYDVFLRAQIAGDQMPSEDPLQYKPGTGFFALSPEFQDERVDALTRGFLGFTVACAQCHDHKFDPIPTKDFYALQGVFASSKIDEVPLAPEAEVSAYKERKKQVDKQEERLKRFYQQQTEQLAEFLAARTARYLAAAQGIGPEEGLEPESLERWKTYLREPRKDHPYLKAWYEMTARQASDAELRAEASRLQTFVVDLFDEKRRVDRENEIRLGLDPSRSDLANANLVSLERDKYIFWRDLFAPGTKDSAGFFSSADGVYYYGRNKIERFLHGYTKGYLDDQRAVLEDLKKKLPEQYPFLHTLRDGDKPGDIPILIRGDRNNKGDIAPRAFLSILASGSPKPFQQGSGRVELANAITSPDNPLTARVIVNRVWLEHFGRGIVNTPGNFGQLGERPTHPELLDYLAARLIESKWSLKSLHREIMMSAVYQLAAVNQEPNITVDADNYLFWRFNRRRMDIETIRDSMLFVSGNLDAKPAEKPLPFDGKNNKRTVYGQISRRRPEPSLALFDFPNPNAISEKRIPTSIPPQRLFFMNSPFVEEQAKGLAARLTGEPEARIEQAYRLLMGRAPDEAEMRLALDFLKTQSWTQYARVLLSSNEFLFMD